MGTIKIYFNNRFTNDYLHSFNRFYKVLKIDELSIVIKTYKTIIFKVYFF